MMERFLSNQLLIVVSSDSHAANRTNSSVRFRALNFEFKTLDKSLFHITTKGVQTIIRE